MTKKKERFVQIGMCVILAIVVCIYMFGDNIKAITANVGDKKVTTTQEPVTDADVYHETYDFDNIVEESGASIVPSSTIESTQAQSRTVATVTSINRQTPIRTVKPANVTTTKRKIVQKSTTKRKITTTKKVVVVPKTTKKVVSKTTKKVVNTTAARKVPTSGEIQALRARLIDLINSERAANKSKNLKINDNLQSATNIRVKESWKSFSHTRPSGGKWYTAITTMQYNIKDVAEILTMTTSGNNNSRNGTGVLSSVPNYIGNSSQLNFIANNLFCTLCYNNSFHKLITNSSFSDMGISIDGKYLNSSNVVTFNCDIILY